jgi:fructose-bisphosphate aldolase class I
MIEAKAAMLKKINDQNGFFAALDQSGGSTPKALGLYGIEKALITSEKQMFTLVHDMRTRIITSDAFDGKRILGAILFENTLDRTICGLSPVEYLWKNKNVVSFLKIDKGLMDEVDGVQLMKPIVDLELLLDKAVLNHVFGTKMRSVIKLPNPSGIGEIVNQQFELAKLILEKGLVPIIEPEVDIHAADKRECEYLLLEAILSKLTKIANDSKVILKLTLPEIDGFYEALVNHPRVLKVVALSGGYNRDLANEKVSRNPGVVASFSRALTEGLSFSMSNDNYIKSLNDSIDSIYKASLT